jgi:timeless protein
MNLTIPVECLLSVDVLSSTVMGRQTIFELSQLLVSGKEAFVDSRNTRAVMDHMKHILEKVIIS